MDASSASSLGDETPPAARSRLPWTIKVILVFTTLPIVAALIIGPLIWSDMIGDDGDPLLALVAVVAGCLPLAAGWALRHGNQVAWLALMVLAVGLVIVYFPTWGIVLPLLLLALLVSPQTRHHLHSGGRTDAAT
jgi:hypothetical protein